MARFFKCLHILLPAIPQALQRDADETLTMYIPNRVKKVVLYGKTVVKLHLTLRVINCGLLQLNIYSWYSCTLVVLKNQCLIYYGYPFFDNAFFSYHCVYINNVLFCVSNSSLIRDVHWICKLFCACVRDWMDLNINEQKAEHMRTE